MSEEEIEAIEYIKEFKNEVFEGVGNKSIMAKNIDILLNIFNKQQEKIKEYKKFKKDIVSKIMFWDKEGLPKDEVIIRMLDTLMDEVSRLEDIEDKKVEVAIDFIEAKRDKFWKDKIRELLEEYRCTGYYEVEHVLEELLEEK